MKLDVGVKILLTNKSGRFLIVQRSSEKYPVLGGSWDIPGGRIKAGTDLLSNLKREVREEIGIVYSGSPRLIGAQDIIKTPDRHVVRLTYMDHIEGAPILSEEHTAFQWVTINEMKALSNLDPYLRQVIEKIDDSHETSN